MPSTSKRRPSAAKAAKEKSAPQTGRVKTAREGAVKFMHKARNEKNDEFYTRLVDIERELKHYKKHFKNKVVLCNCDDPRESNFVKFFSMNFEHFGLKKLIATHFKDADLFTRERPYKLEYTGAKKGNRFPEPADFMKAMIGTGDFRSEECIELLEQADIVVTNPPFSLFREYMAQLEEYGKKFLIVANWNALTYKETFKLIKDNRFWLGINSNRNFSGFIVPKHYELHGTEARVDEDGNRIVSSNNTCWFTNLDVAKRHDELILYKTYNRREFPKYDNYDVIEVSKTADIPMDYSGVMGVPITFLDKYNPEQFDILGIANSARWIGYECLTVLQGRKVYNRIIIRNRKLAAP